MREKISTECNFALTKFEKIIHFDLGAKENQANKQKIKIPFILYFHFNMI